MSERCFFRLVSLLLLAVLPWPSVCEAEERLSAFARAQAKKREKRKALIQKQLAALRDSASRFAADMESLVNRCSESHLAALGKEILDEIRDVQPDRGNLGELAKALGQGGEEAPDLVASGIRRARDTARKAHAKRVAGVAKTLLKNGLYGHADACVLQVVRFDPAHRLARGLQGVAYDARSRRWVAVCVQPGHREGRRVWDRKLGWVFERHRAKYDEGLYPRTVKGSIVGWEKLKDLNLRHRSLDRPWVLQTRHFSIRVCTDLQKGVAVANGLEEIHHPLMVVMAQLSGSGGLAGKADRTKVSVLHSLDMVRDYRRRYGVSGTLLRDDTSGFYSNSRQVAVVGPHPYPDPVKTARHEVGHAFLWAFLPGARPGEVLSLKKATFFTSPKERQRNYALSAACRRAFSFAA